MIEGRDLVKAYGTGRAQVRVLRGLNLAVARGEFVSVMGPSGCGKSTLLHVLGLITPADSGVVALDGEPAPDGEGGRAALRRERIGFVFQRFNLLNVLSAIDNVAISLRLRGQKLDGNVRHLFEWMGVAHVMRRRPAEMSIGEQQRVAVVRALAHRPAIVLADEPTGNLDSENAEALLALLVNLNRQFAQTIVMITHSPAAAAHADRVVTMRDGRILHATS
ncbi:MAG: ABC transporter ATP-binding protein [Phycisphaerae bacterium]|nr:ABC transporter ATP-binding protein [Phycisphaerae bacterium]